MGIESCHPLVAASYFTVVIILTAILDHPVFLAISWFFALMYLVKLEGAHAFRFIGSLVIIAVVFAAVFTANVHFGITVLTHTHLGNPVTLESLAYGVLIGFKIGAVFMWLRCLVDVFTADKVVYLFGRVSPRLALFSAVALRSAPLVGAQMTRLSNAQRSIGLGAGQGSVSRRLRNWVRRVSALITWAIERMTQMSDSMRSRGSSLRGRTAFALVRFDARDRKVAIGLAFLFSIVLFGISLDQARMLFDPEMIANVATPLSFLFFLSYAMLCATPLVILLVSESRFARDRSKVKP